MSFDLILQGAFVSLVVGLLIGWSGIAGFLLPIWLTAVAHLEVRSALCISFTCFLVSGILGSEAYRRKGELDVKASLPLGVGSLLGAIAGVILNAKIASHAVSVILYIVVLASGIGILLRCFLEKKQEDKDHHPSPVTLALFGIVTAAICSLSGAGGPILVMPLLVVIGYGTRHAVAISLFDSICIALPSLMGYAMISDMRRLLPLIFGMACTHAVGVTVGALTSRHIPQKGLKIGVGIFSLLIAFWRLF